MSDGTRGDGNADGDGPADTEAGVAAAGGDLGVEVDPDASGPAAFMQALAVPRNAKWGAVAGVAFTLLVFFVFVVLPGTYRSPLWYVGLGFVLAVSTAGLVATALTLVRAARLSRNL